VYTTQSASAKSEIGGGGIRFGMVQNSQQNYS